MKPPQLIASHTLHEIYLASFGNSQLKTAKKLNLHRDVLIRLLARLNDTVKKKHPNLTVNLAQLKSFRTVIAAEKYYGEDLFNKKLQFANTKKTLHSIHAEILYGASSEYGVANNLGLHGDSLKLILKKMGTSYEEMKEMTEIDAKKLFNDYDQIPAEVNVTIKSDNEEKINVEKTKDPSSELPKIIAQCFADDNLLNNDEETYSIDIVDSLENEEFYLNLNDHLYVKPTYYKYNPLTKTYGLFTFFPVKPLLPSLTNTNDEHFTAKINNQSTHDEKINLCADVAQTTPRYNLRSKK